MDCFENEFHGLYKAIDACLRKGDFAQFHALIKTIENKKLTGRDRVLMDYLFGRMYIGQNKYRKAEKKLKKAIRNIDKNSYIDCDMYLYSLCLFEFFQLKLDRRDGQKYLALTLNQFNKIRETYPDFEAVEVLYCLGVLKHFDGDCDEAKRLLGEAIERCEDDHMAGMIMEAIGSVCFSLQNFEEAIIYLEDALRLIERDWLYLKILLMLGQSYYHVGDIYTAERMLNEVKNDLKNLSIVRLNNQFYGVLMGYLGMISYANINYEKSIEYLSRAVSGENNKYDYAVIDYLFALADSYVNMDNIKKAIHCYKKIIKSSLASEEERNNAKKKLRQ